jgi:Holliday junction resolvase RusA-like endonuclease
VLTATPLGTPVQQYVSQLRMVVHFLFDNVLIMEREVIDLQESDDESVNGNDQLVNVAATLVTTVVVNGPPEAMARPVFMNWLRGDKMHRRVTNKKTPKIAAFRKTFMETLQAMNQATVLTYPLFPQGPVALEVQFYRRLPNLSFKGSDRSRPFSGGLYGDGRRYYDMCRPDVDNLLKFVMDALNGVLYKDDAQVVKTVAYKLLDTERPCDGRTIVRFKAADNSVDVPL